MKRHRLDVLSLVFGILFVAAAAAFASDTFDLSLFRWEWVAAAVLLVIGGVLLVTARSSGNGRNGS